jgi:hypothetical protein
LFHLFILLGTIFHVIANILFILWGEQYD